MEIENGWTKRTTYRHGDLHRALVEAGTELARIGGPDAVVLREATRRAGVVPNAAYRHFADRHALLRAVCNVALSAAANAMEVELDAVPPDLDPANSARARLRAVGVGYLRFAQTEPGLFRTAFSVDEDVSIPATPAMAGRSGLTPFQILNSVLDEMVETGVLTLERRQGAEFVAWSAVHGLAMLVIDGPLRGLDQDQTNSIALRLLDMVDRGL